VSPVAAFQIRAVVSADAVTMRVPSGLNAAPSTRSVCPDSVATVQLGLASTIRAVPSKGRGDDARAVGTESRAVKRPVVAGDDGKRRASPEGPYARPSTMPPASPSAA